MELNLLQQDFRDWLRRSDEDAATRLGLADARGLAVYQSNYRTQLMDCLEESYPQTLAWLGVAGFRAAAAGFVDDCPPHSWTLDDYPAGFPAWLHSSFPDDAEIAELAALELRLSECFIAADAEPLDLAGLAEVDWDRAELRLVPSGSLLAQHTNAAQIWSALSAGSEPPPAVRLPEPLALLVWRQDYVSCFRVIGPKEQELYAKLMAGLGFADLCADLVASLGEAEGIAKAGTLLASWAQEEALRRPPPADEKLQT